MSEKLKRKYLLLPEVYLLDILSGKLRITNIPENSKFINAEYDIRRASFYIIIENESFDPVYDGEFFHEFMAECEDVRAKEYLKVNNNEQIKP